ncbi:MAG TPA: hypothetical protein VGA37_16610, partial [Gemmatimonadales bacterium]
MKPRLGALRATRAEAQCDVDVLQDVSPAKPAPSAGFTRRITGRLVCRSEAHAARGGASVHPTEPTAIEEASARRIGPASPS